MSVNKNLVGWPLVSPGGSLLVVAVCSLLTSERLSAEDQYAGDIIFDQQTLKGKGLDAKVSDHFRSAPRFLPGATTVTLIVNGQERGRVKASFGEQGQLCPDVKFMNQAGLAYDAGAFRDGACVDLRERWPQAEINLNPADEQIELVVPTEAIAPNRVAAEHWSSGGMAGMFNYNTQYLDATSRDTRSTFAQANTEMGVNVGDWIVRSRQTFSRIDGIGDFRHQDAYAQKTFVEQKKVFRTGQISLSNSMFSVGQVYGFQVSPESALERYDNGLTMVEGIADTTSVVEVRQVGVLLYSSVVPAGPFGLKGFSLLNSHSDLEVTLTGSDGAKRTFIVPAYSIRSSGPAVTQGLSFGAGKLYQEYGSAESPSVATASMGWQLSPGYTVGAGALVSTPYRATALGMDAQLFNSTQLSLLGTASQDTNHGENGFKVFASVTQPLTENVSVSVNTTQQTFGYRELYDAVQTDYIDTRGYVEQQYGAGINWNTGTLGNLSASWSTSTSFDGTEIRYARAGWSRQFGRVYVGASLEQNTGLRGYGSEQRAFLTVNIPIGKSSSLNSYVNATGDGNRYGSRYTDNSNLDRSWSVSADQDSRTGRTSTVGSLALATPVSQLSGSLSKDTDQYTSWSAQASGGAVLHSDGIVFSAQPIGDTFGVAKVGTEKGVRLNTPGGDTWTNSNGYAALPMLSAYNRSAIQLDTRSLGKNVDINNAVQEADAARGSVSTIDFEVIRTRRVLANVQSATDKPLPQGASVFAADGNLVTVVNNNGSVFIPDATPGMALEVQSSGRTICRFTLELPEMAPSDGLFENVTTQCQ